MLSNTWSWIKTEWNKFEAWVYTWMPGWKTHICTGLGALGSAAAVLQQYITGLPTSTFIDATQLAIATTVLFTLAFWFHNMGDRVGA